MMLLLNILVGCVHWVPPAPLTHGLETTRACDGTTLIKDGRLAVFPTESIELPLRQGALNLVDTVYAVDSNGRLLYNDTIRGPTLPHQKDCKLDMSEISTSPIGGELRDTWTITPTHNVLSTLDSGIGLQWSWKDQQGTIRYAPSYASSTFSPYMTYGPTGRHGSVGFHPNDNGRAYSGDAGGNGASGKNGSAGSNGQNAWMPGQSGGHGGDGGRGGRGRDGSDGRDASSLSGNGGNGSNGTPGGHGSHGGNGGNGFPGNNAEDGEYGQRGVDGPDLTIVVRPIYSPFYPGEELVYIEVKGNQNGRSSTENYIFHQGHPFVITTQGGQGGDGGNGGEGGHGGGGGRGGDGGRGGHGGNGGNGGDGGNGDSAQGISAGRDGNGGNGSRGGNGGNGGDGGNGATGGCGGDGGNGGRGGDGGDIQVKVLGSSSFQQQAVNSLVFRSLGGRGGSGGLAGRDGSTGLGGRAGYAGQGGDGGSGGSGYQYGKSAPSGSSGSSGRSGFQGGSRYCDADNGRQGPIGTSGSVQIQLVHTE